MHQFIARITVAVLVVTALIADLAPVGEAPQAAAATYPGHTIVYRGAGDVARIGLIGDSSLAGVRWYGTYGNLASYNYRFNAESCRRTIDASCRGREGFAPYNAVRILRHHGVDGAACW